MTTWTPQPKNSSTLINKRVRAMPALAGMYYGFGAFTYSGGQEIYDSATEWANGTKNSAAFTNLTKN